MPAHPAFTTERLILLSLILRDNKFILELVNTPGWLRFIGDRNVRTARDASAYINKVIKNPALTYWVVKRKENQTAIGIITFIKRDYLDFHDIGFAFLPAFEKSGYAFEATAAVLKYLSEEGLQQRILATTIPDNTASIRLLTKLGFQPDREIRVNEQQLLVYGLSL